MKSNRNHAVQVDLVDQATASGDEVEGTSRKLGLKLYRTCVKVGSWLGASLSLYETGSYCPM